MTVEQLNVIVTAQTEDFQQKIEGVNRSLAQTLALAQNSASAIAGISVNTGEEDFARTAKVNGGYSEKASSPSAFALDIPEVSGAAANVLSLRTGETLIGAVSENAAGGENSARPIEIYTTVELDGEKVGESMGLYNSARSRITNGWS